MSQTREKKKKTMKRRLRKAAGWMQDNLLTKDSDRKMRWPRQGDGVFRGIGKAGPVRVIMKDGVMLDDEGIEK